MTLKNYKIVFKKKQYCCIFIEKSTCSRAHLSWSVWSGVLADLDLGADLDLLFKDADACHTFTFDCRATRLKITM